MGESPSRPIQQRSTTGLFVVGHPEPYGKSRGLLLELLNGMTSGETARPRGLPGLALAGQGILNSGGLYRPEENGSGNLAENSKSSSLTLGVVHWSNYRLLDSQWSTSVAPLACLLPPPRRGPAIISTAFRWLTVALAALTAPLALVRLRRITFEVDDRGIRTKGRFRPFDIPWDGLDRIEVVPQMGLRF